MCGDRYLLLFVLIFVVLFAVLYMAMVLYVYVLSPSEWMCIVIDTRASFVASVVSAAVAVCRASLLCSRPVSFHCGRRRWTCRCSISASSSTSTMARYEHTRTRARVAV